LVALFSSALGIYQHFSDSFRPFATAGSSAKLGYYLVAEQKALASPAMGFFEHPNSLATFLILALMVNLGWLREKGHLIFKISSAILILLALIWTYSKAQLLVFALLFGIFWLSQIIRSRRIFLILSITLLIIGSILFFILMNTFPDLFGTFFWRVDLWKSALFTLSENPGTLLIGNGDTSFAQIAIWPQPHNIYLDFALNYGLVGLLFLIGLGVIMVITGLSAFRNGALRESPIAMALWLAILIFFFLGLVETSLIGIETRMMFLLLLATFYGLRREIMTEKEIILKSESTVQ
jgi:O-antigen ligase